MKFGKIIPVLLLGLLFIPGVTYARNFLRTLQVGSVGQDVLFVQKILNLSPLTQIAQTGPGSPGNETVFFGNATKNAIIKFQTLYSADILTPAGLSYATGVAGSFTLKKINELSLSNTTQIATSSSGGLKTQIASKPIIDSISPSVFGNGETIIITGKNFDTTNTVMVSVESDDKYTNISSNGTSIFLQINSVFADALTKGMQSLSANQRADAIQYLISKGKFVAGPGDGSAYIPVTIYVKSKNGSSNSVNGLFRAISK
ncbi:MAG: IPT/TIG domain-containing protein [bacterium]